MSSDKSPYREVGLHAYANTKGEKRRPMITTGDVTTTDLKPLRSGHSFPAAAAKNKLERQAGTAQPCRWCKKPRYQVEFKKCRMNPNRRAR